MPKNPTTTLSGYAAIEYAEANELLLSKYNDPTEDAREDVTPDEARKIAEEDPRLIYIEVLSLAGKVEAGKPGTEDYDTGKVVDLDRGYATVAWDSGVRTKINIAELRLVKND
jgi:hypothetical protein